MNKIIAVFFLFSLVSASHAAALIGFKYSTIPYLGAPDSAGAGASSPIASGYTLLLPEVGKIRPEVVNETITGLTGAGVVVSKTGMAFRYEIARDLAFAIGMGSITTVGQYADLGVSYSAFKEKAKFGSSSLEVELRGTSTPDVGGLSSSSSQLLLSAQFSF
ncbi:MAG: hypothetical protein OEY11_06720 [Gammaproteobacteria bacterium]|nr:hypothetical protein [Gammaproteobacteria bacterium]